VFIFVLFYCYIYIYIYIKLLPPPLRHTDNQNIELLRIYEVLSCLRNYRHPPCCLVPTAYCFQLSNATPLKPTSPHYQGTLVWSPSLLTAIPNSNLLVDRASLILLDFISSSSISSQQPPRPPALPFHVPRSNSHGLICILEACPNTDCLEGLRAFSQLQLYPSLEPWSADVKGQFGSLTT